MLIYTLREIVSLVKIQSYRVPLWRMFIGNFFLFIIMIFLLLFLSLARYLFRLHSHIFVVFRCFDLVRNDILLCFILSFMILKSIQYVWFIASLSRSVSFQSFRVWWRQTELLYVALLVWFDNMHFLLLHFSITFKGRANILSCHTYIKRINILPSVRITLVLSLVVISL